MMKINAHMRFVQNFHRRNFRLKLLHRQFHLISTVLVIKTQKNEWKWRNLHRWQKFYTAAGSDGIDKFHLWRIVKCLLKHQSFSWETKRMIVIILRENLLLSQFQLGGKMFRCFQMFLWTIVTHAWWAALSSRRGAQDTTWNKTKCGILIEMRSGVFWRGKGHVAQKLTIGQFIISEVRSLENMWCSEQMIIERYKVTGTQKISCQERE